MLRHKELGRIQVPIGEILIGERIRTEPGDLDLLALSISLHGLLDPIIVHQIEEHKYELVDGFCRISAMKMLHKTEIDCRLFSTLDEETKRTLELELCLRRKSLTYAEEAKACKSILEAKRRKSILGGIGRFSGVIKNKDVAKEIGMSEAAFSQNIKIADALEAHPELGNLKNKKEVLHAISKGEYKCLAEGTSHAVFLESFIVDTPLNMVSSITNKIVDFAILHPDVVDEELFTSVNSKLKLGGAMIIFTTMEDVPKWTTIAGKQNLYTSPSPYIWHIKGEDTYMPFVWIGKAREMPLRAIPMHLSYPRTKTAMSLKAKPYNLMSTLIKSNTESLGFVVSTPCEDIETIRVCIDLNRNIRGSCMDKILHDRLIMSLQK